MQKNENFQKSDIVIKIWVFDAAEYDGAVEFSLKPLPSEKNSNFLHFFEIKINYAKMSKYVLIWVLKYSYLMPLNTVVCVHFS